VSAFDRKTRTNVAIKKNVRIFARDGNTLIPLRVLRELSILSHLSHPNLISLKDVITPPSYEQFSDMYLVTEQMETDLRCILRSGQVLTDEHVQYILFQLLAAVNYIHSASILHRDLKPEVINSN
jgi:serine/threonine protein kinase